MLVRSRNGYNSSGERRLDDAAEVFDVLDDDGKVVGEITAKQLVGHLNRCYRAKKTPKYSNCIGNYAISNPDKKRTKVLTVIGVDDKGKIYGGNDEYSKCSVVARENSKDYLFEFSNGFVIGVHDFVVLYPYSDFGTVSFKLFGEKETFSVGKRFVLGISISECSDGLLRGSVSVEQTYAGEHGPGDVKLSDFELRPDGSVYKDIAIDVVYNKARYAKELLLNG